jgi:phosphocarrier protein
MAATDEQQEPRPVTREMVIKNKYGIHARPAALLTKIASRYESDCYIEKNGNRVSGKSIMGLMTLEASHGSKLVVTAQGEDAEELLDEIEELVTQKFNEE